MGTKGGEGCTSHSSPDTTTSLEADGDTDSSSRLHIPPSNAIQGEESLKGNGVAKMASHAIFQYILAQVQNAKLL